MSQPEARLSRKIMTAIRAHGYFCFKVHGSEFMTAGLPDIIVCAESLFIGLETKMPDKRHNTSVRQEYVADQIREAGGHAQVVTSVNEALEAIDAAIKQHGRP